MTEEDSKTNQNDEQDQQEFDWPPLESNPEVLTDYLHQIGLAPAYAIGEVFSFDEELLAFLPQPIYGVIVALERLEDGDKSKEGDSSYPIPFYMKQTESLDNACGIVACLHAILNSNNSTNNSMIRPDSVLSQFQAATAHQAPAERARALEDDRAFRTVHQKFALKGQSAAITSDQSQVRHHYVAFVVVRNNNNGHDQLVELDGTKQGPHVVQDNCSDVLRGTIAAIRKRLAEGKISEQLSMMTLHACE